MVVLHLNLSGGLTGDMFIAAVLDAFPRFEQRVIRAIDALDSPYPVICSLVAHSDYEVTGHRFEIEPFDKYFGHIPLAFPQEPAPWESVRDRLGAAEIRPDVRTHATKIFELLVGAEAAVHGILPERVAFEAGAWNSLAQVVGAATLYSALVGLTVSARRRGDAHRRRHCRLPVPARFARTALTQGRFVAQKRYRVRYPYVPEQLYASALLRGGRRARSAGRYAGAETR